jgi:RNA polymerase sigma-70 factor (ECF subfamily)
MLSASAPGVVRALPFEGNDVALVAGVLSGHAGAATAFYDRHVGAIQRLVYRLMGPDPEIEDIVHDVFLRALESMPRLREPAALRGWVFGIAVRVVRIRMQRRSRQRWLKFMSPEHVPEVPSGTDGNMGDAVREVYALLERLPVNERIALVLHRVEGVTLEQAAAACETSLATFRRRLARAEAKFFARASTKAALAPWLGETT